MGKPAAHYCTPMLLHELAEIIGMDDVSFRPGSDERARLEPAEIDPFLYFVGALENDSATLQKARISIYSDRRHPSRIVLPLTHQLQ